jgi:hypothetical protein
LILVADIERVAELCPKVKLEKLCILHNFIYFLFVHVDLLLVALSSIEGCLEVLTCDHNWIAIQYFLVCVNDHIFQKERSVTGFLQSQVIEPGLPHLLLYHVEISNEVEDNKNTDHTESTNDCLPVVPLVLGQFSGSFFKSEVIIILLLVLLFVILIPLIGLQ